MHKHFGIITCLLIFISFGSHAASNQPQAHRIVINSGDWQLVGDWQDALTPKQKGTVLLLHKAAGNRDAYTRMARVLAVKGYASLRIDLRGHGESTNVRAFDPTISRFENPNDPNISANFALINQGYLDIIAVINWLTENKQINCLPFAIIGASYTGEQMIKATTSVKFADAYIALAPGNFSLQSLEQVDPSGKPFLFVRAEKEMAFMDDVFAAIRKGSKAEIWVLPGEGHATDLFINNENIEQKLASWLDKQLTQE